MLLINLSKSINYANEISCQTSSRTSLSKLSLELISVMTHMLDWIMMGSKIISKVFAFRKLWIFKCKALNIAYCI